MKTTKKFIAVLLAVTFVFVLFSCDDAPHVHTFSEDWTSDETYHWHKATCEHTEEVSGKAEHTFGDWITDKDATIKEKGTKHRICTVCDYRQDGEIDILDHTCTASTTYDHDENKHWFKCTNPLCDKHLQEADHNFNIGSKSEDGKVTMSCVCGESKVVENAVLVDSETTLKSAVDDESGTIILKNDIALENTVSITKDVTIDLNGKTISSTKRVFLVEAGILTLDNGTVKAEITSAGSSVIRVSAEAESITEKTSNGNNEDETPDAAVVLKKDAKIVAPTSYGISAFGRKATADAKRYITLDIYGTIESGNPCIGGDGTSTSDNTVVTINVYDGAVLTATNDLTVTENNDKVTIYQPNPGTLNIKGGTITSKRGSAVEIRAGNAYITGGRLVSEAATYSATANGSGPTVIGAAVAVSQHTTAKPIRVVIEGGTLESSSGKKLAVESLQGKENNDEILVGGYINVVDIDSLKIGKDFKGGLYLADKESPGEVYYAGNSSEVFAEIINSAPKVILLDDITLNSAVKIGSGDKKQTTLTIDMNGKTISGKTDSSFGSSLFDICNAKVTFDGTGTLQDTGSYYGEIMVRGSSTCAIDYTVVTVNKGITCKGGQAVWVNKNFKGEYSNYGVKVNFYGTADLSGVNDYAFYIQGLNNKEISNAPVFNIEGATITAGNDVGGLGIYAAGYGIWNIKDTTITGRDSAIEIRAGVLNIEGGTYTATATGFKCNANGNGTTTEGAAIAVAQHTTKLPVSVNISGGEFSGCHAMSVQNPQKTEKSNDVVVNVTGGKFTAKDSNAVVNAETEYFEISENATYSPSASFTVEAKTTTV